MTNKVRDNLSKVLLPSAEELWNRADAEMRIVPSSDTQVPFFDDEITDVALLKEYDLYRKDGDNQKARRFGHEAVFAFHLGTVDYLASFSQPEGIDSEKIFTVSRSTAYTAMPGGNSRTTSHAMVDQARVPHIEIGPPHSTNKLGRAFEPLRTPRTFRDSLNMSLARSTQAEMKITRYLVDEFGLSETLVPVGGSRADIVTPAKYPYAEYEGMKMLDFDTLAKCSLERYALEHTGKFTKWLLETALGGLAAGVALARDGELGTIRGVTSLNPNFIVARATGDLRALASDEPLRMMSWLPSSAKGLETIYARDTLCDEELVRQLLSDHKDVYLKLVPHGNHGSFIHPKAKNAAVMRMVRRADEYRRNAGDAEAMAWDYIYGKVEHPWQANQDGTVYEDSA